MAGMHDVADVTDEHRTKLVRPAGSKSGTLQPYAKVHFKASKIMVNGIMSSFRLRQEVIT